MAPSTLFRNIHLFDGEVEIPRANVLVEGGIITQVSVDPIEPPDSSTIIISKENHVLIPGIIDAHVHCDQGKTALGLALKFGVTTLCDLHQEVEFLDILRKQAALPQNADYKTCSVAATIPGGWPTQVVTAHDKSEATMKLVSEWPKLATEQDVDAYMEDRVKEKVDYIKMMHEDGLAIRVKPPIPSLELQRHIVKAAHEKGLIAMVHCLSLPATIQMLEVGVDGLAHTFCDQAPTQELVDAYKKNNAYCNPSLAAMGTLTAASLEDQKKYAHDARIMKLTSEEVRHGLCRCLDMAAETSKFEYAVESVRVLKAAGIDILVGSDSAGPALGLVYGVSTHREMHLLVNECGFTPAETIRAATSLVAKRYKFADRGRIAPGMRADLVLVEGNILQDIDHSLDLRGVWKQGVLLGMYEETALS